MQKYNNMSKEANICKKTVMEFLDFLKFKVDADSLTMEDVKCLARAIMEGVEVRATVEDLAGFYGKSEDCIRHVISRSVAEKPKRRVMYTFSKFSRAVPSSWKSPTERADSQRLPRKKS